MLAQDNLDSPVCIAMQVQLARRLLTDFLQASSQAMREHHLGDPSGEGYVLPPSGDDARGAE